jgi:hypothetical protein
MQMKFLGLISLTLLITLAASMSSCSPVSRSKHALVVDDYGSMRYINGRPDRVHKKWKKNSYQPKNNKVAKRKTADW